MDFLDLPLASWRHSLRAPPEPVILVPICIRREDLTEGRGGKSGGGRASS